MDKDSSGKFDIELIKSFFSDFKNIIEHGDNEQKSSIIKSYINRILFDPDKEEITIEFFEIPQDKKIITTTKCGGGTRTRTGDKGFADLCLTAWLCRP